MELYGTMREITTVVKMDDQGRVRIPLPAREALGVKDSGALLEIVIRIVGEEMGNADSLPIPA
jgi:bifunctional DNA-binding transcriptional regulator/antitoxin component of YhaV-PrlF toxin-antitoxin module